MAKRRRKLRSLPPSIQAEGPSQQRIEQQRQAAQSANPNDPIISKCFWMVTVAHQLIPVLQELRAKTKRRKRKTASTTTPAGGAADESAPKGQGPEASGISTPSVRITTPATQNTSSSPSNRRSAIPILLRRSSDSRDANAASDATDPAVELNALNDEDNQETETSGARNLSATQDNAEGESPVTSPNAATEPEAAEDESGVDFNSDAESLTPQETTSGRQSNQRLSSSMCQRITEEMAEAALVPLPDEYDEDEDDDDGEEEEDADADEPQDQEDNEEDEELNVEDVIMDFDVEIQNVLSQFSAPATQDIGGEAAPQTYSTAPQSTTETTSSDPSKRTTETNPTEPSDADGATAATSTSANETADAATASTSATTDSALTSTATEEGDAASSSSNPTGSVLAQHQPLQKSASRFA